MPYNNVPSKSTILICCLTTHNDLVIALTEYDLPKKQLHHLVGQIYSFHMTSITKWCSSILILMRRNIRSTHDSSSPCYNAYKYIVCKGLPGYLVTAALLDRSVPSSLFILDSFPTFYATTVNWKRKWISDCSVCILKYDINYLGINIIIQRTGKKSKKRNWYGNYGVC